MFTDDFKWPKECKAEIEKAISDYKCLGGWWTFDDKIPYDVKFTISRKHNISVDELIRYCHEYSAEEYHYNKPSLSSYCD